MNAESLLIAIAKALNKAGLEAVMIGNSAAALQGAPVTTIDFDFMFRKTPVNIKKLKILADFLGAQVYRPFYPVSDVYRLTNDDNGLQLDFMATVHGVKSFASLRLRALRATFGGFVITVASLDDIIKSKTEAGRDRDRAVLPILEKTLREKGLQNEAITKKITKQKRKARRT